jgi:hypothetical protein
MSKTLCIQTFATRHEAEFARSLLESQGIKAMVSADDGGGMRPDLALTSGGVKLYVLEENAARAEELLQKAKE